MQTYITAKSQAISKIYTIEYKTNTISILATTIITNSKTNNANKS